jgi:hypothetical protein
VASLASGSETFGLGPDTLVVNSVELVLKHIEFKTQGDSTPCGEGEHQNVGEEDCNELEIGPVLADLPLGGGLARLFTVPVPAGTYNGLEFKIHKPGSDADDSTFVADHPDLRDVSIRVTGTFNHAAFTFTSHVTAKQEQEFTSPVVVSPSSGIDVTIMADLNGWFLDQAQTNLVDPATALPGGPNEVLVSQNIRRSFRAFRDQDHDGHEDH